MNTVEDVLISILPQLGLSVIPLYAAYRLFIFLMESNRDYRLDLQTRNKYLETENKELRQALFASRDPDAMRLSTALLSRTPQTNLGEPQ